MTTTDDARATALEDFRKSYGSHKIVRGYGFVRYETYKVIEAALQPQDGVMVPNDWVKQVSELPCPEAYGFEGLDTYPDCGVCVVCKAKALQPYVKGDK